MKILKKFAFSLITIIFIGIVFYLLLLYVYYDKQTKELTDMSLKQSPWQSFKEIISISLNGSNLSIFEALINTLKHFFFSFLLAIIGGVSIGTLAGSYKWLNQSSEYPLNFFRVLPSIVFITIFKYLFRLSESYVYYVGTIASIWPIMISTKAGVEKVNRTLRDTIRILNLPRIKKLFLFTLPEAYPDIHTGIKTSMGISFLIAITCEYLFKDLKGLGSYLSYFEIDCAACVTQSMFVILIIGLIGILLNLILEFIENRSPWLKNQFSESDEHN